MAYTRAGSSVGTMPVPGVDPGVISIHIENSASATDRAIKVPWNGCRLVYAYTVNHTAIDGDGDMVMTLELDEAGGTTLGTITPVASGAVGTVTEVVWSAKESARSLTSANSINVEVDGSTTGTGAVQLFLYFEPDTQ